MFKKWGTEDESMVANDEQKVSEVTEPPVATNSIKTNKNDSINTILRGSKLKGDINVTCDLELSGDVEGNITSAQDSSIVIKGSCKGNIETKGGSVVIDGRLSEGNIIAGGDVTISGKFDGGEIMAKGKVYINGDFNGKLEGNEVELGAKASGKGEISYIENISIAKGANIEVQISRGQKELKLIKSEPEKKPVPNKKDEEAVAAAK
ncbi:MAG: polymer-forming cytoskeletal protein [Nitrospiraceae bacterium]|nr:MAG: polymer-forming cytoskeletal protein [Nitrospiraceae bacterium]